MATHNLAIVNCRVSSTEQLENNSLNRQRDAVLKAAENLGVKIPEDGWWSGSVSSKKGTNVNRKDLQEMLTYCKEHRRVKYLIVDEVDRFMRSMLEIGYFIIEFKKLGVEVIFASQPDIKIDTASDTLMLMLEAFKAEGSNEERQRKSIAGQMKALAEGRYPFPPKPGYMLGYERAIPEVDPIKGPALKGILLRIINREVTPTEGLIELNKSEFMRSGHSLYKMDKFRLIATDPFYAGVVEINKQVKFRNENALHEKLISMDQHLELVKIFSNKAKTQSGPRKNGNPKYPLNNLIEHDTCISRKYGRVVGVDLNNGKNKLKVYEKYRCRACLASLPRDEMHTKIIEHFRKNPISDKGIKALVTALKFVWGKKEGQLAQDKLSIRRKIDQLNEKLESRAEAALDETNVTFKNQILKLIEKTQKQISDLENDLTNLDSKFHDDEERFLMFALNFAKNMGESFLDPSLSEVNRKRCKQIIFPAGFRMDADKNVYTPEISQLIRLTATKKSAEALNNSHLVRVRRL